MNKLEINRNFYRINHQYSEKTSADGTDISRKSKNLNVERLSFLTKQESVSSYDRICTGVFSRSDPGLYVKYDALRQFMNDEIFDDPKETEKVVNEFELLNKEKISPDEFAMRIDKFLSGLRDEEARAFIKVAEHSLPGTIRKSLCRTYQKPRVFKALSLLLAVGGANAESCRGLKKLTVNNEAYNPSMYTKDIGRYCKTIKKYGDRNFPVNIDTRRSEKWSDDAIIKGEFNPLNGVIELSLTPDNPLGDPPLENTIRHETRHSELYHENHSKGIWPPTANPCASRGNKEACEDLFIDLYNTLASFKMSKQQFDEFAKFSLGPAGGFIFDFVSQSSEGDLKKAFGEKNVKITPIKGGKMNAFIVTIPKGRKEATQILANCLANVREDLRRTYASKWPLHTEIGRERMAAELEAKLIGYLGKENTSKLIHILNPELAQTLKERSVENRTDDL